MSRFIVSATATAIPDVGLVRIVVSVCESNSGIPIEGLKKDNFIIRQLAGPPANFLLNSLDTLSPGGFYMTILKNVPPPPNPQLTTPFDEGTIDFAIVVKKKKDKARVGEDPFHRGQIVVQAS